MSRRARLRERQDMKRRPIPDSPIPWDAIANDRAKREQQHQPKAPQ